MVEIHMADLSTIGPSRGKPVYRNGSRFDQNNLRCLLELLVIVMQAGTLHFISGRLAAGKTTLARSLAAEHHAVFFCEDVWLSKLSDGISSFDEYLKWSRRCRSVMGPLIVDTLRAGASVVLDFGGNRLDERAW